jgi:hypothetical protein
MIEDNLVDVFFTEDGDFYLNRKNKRIHLASKYRNEITESLIKKRIQSSSIDWRCNSIVVANLDVFKGMPRTNDIINEIQLYIKNALIEDFLINPDNIKIISLGGDRNIVTFGVLIDGRDPSLDSTISFNMLYDFRENKFTPLDVMGVYR